MEEKTERDKALAEAHRRYVEAVEKARREYVETKRKLFPELATAGAAPAELARQLGEKDRRIAELEAKLKKLEADSPKKEGEK